MLVMSRKKNESIVISDEVTITVIEIRGDKVRLGIVDPVGQQMLPDPPTVDVQVELPGADTNLVIDFNNLPFNRGGIYQVQLFLEGRLIHSMPLNIQAVSAEGLAPVQAN